MKMFAPLYSYLPTPREMSLWDKTTIEEYAHPASMLMETASRGALQTLLERARPTLTTPILIYVGGGNNGGDGIALGRHLHELGYSVMLLAIKALDNLPSPAREHWTMAQKSKVPWAIIPPDSPTFLPPNFTSAGVIVDALMGLGLNKPLSPFLQKIVGHINSFANTCAIFAMDIPSGLCGLKGEPLPVAVKAQATVTFEAPKPGLILPQAKPYAGEIIVHSIGIPEQVKTTHPSSWKLLKPAHKPWLPLGYNLHKGSAGKVLIIGGSKGMEGAPALSALGALYTGSGLVKILCPHGITPAIRTWGMEFLLEGIGQENLWQEDVKEELQEAIADFAPDAIVMGMGMGRTLGAARAVHAVLSMEQRCPLILDADGLFILAHEENFGFELKKSLRENDIITPHPLEAARLLPLHFYARHEDTDDLETLQNNRPEAICALTEETLATTVLKGAGTLMKQRNTPIVLAPYDIPALAVGGSGDVLAGILGSIVGRKSLHPLLSSIDMASFGVYLHAEAGLFLSALSPQGHLAREIAQAVPHVLGRFIDGQSTQ